MLPTRPTDDHLALVQALLQAGQPGRALEMLDAVWRHGTVEERLWFLRLWALVGQGRILDAVEVARIATGTLPGSAAVAYVHAALEHAVGEHSAAIEAALRAAAVLPERRVTEELLGALLETQDRSGLGPEESWRPSLPSVSTSVPSPLAAALTGAALLHPWGSAVALRASPLAASIAVGVTAPELDSRRRLVWMAVATVVAAIWAVRNPLLASAALAAVVAWLTRPRRVHTLND